MEAEQALRSAAQLVPVRGMTQAHIDQVAAWIEQNHLGQLVPARDPGKVLFVPTGNAEEFDEMEKRVNSLFTALHDRFGMDPFHQHNWLLKTVPN